MVAISWGLSCMLSSTAFPRIRRAGFIGSGMAVGLQLGACLDNGLGYSRVHKASAIAILLEVVLHTQDAP